MRLDLRLTEANTEIAEATRKLTDYRRMFVDKHGERHWKLNARERPLWGRPSVLNRTTVRRAVEVRRQRWCMRGRLLGQSGRNKWSLFRYLVEFSRNQFWNRIDLSCKCHMREMVAFWFNNTHPAGHVVGGAAEEHEQSKTVLIFNRSGKEIGNAAWWISIVVSQCSPRIRKLHAWVESSKDVLIYAEHTRISGQTCFWMTFGWFLASFKRNLKQSWKSTMSVTNMLKQSLI